MLDTFRGDFFQAFFDGGMKWSRDAHIETASDERKPERFFCQFSEPHTDAAADAFARLEDDAAGLDDLFKRLTRAAKTLRIGIVSLCVMLQCAVAHRAAVAMQTARRLTRRLAVV